MRHGIKKDRKGVCPLAVFLTSKPVSRVLSFKTAIYLDVELPPRSSRPLNATGPVCCVPTALLRIEFTAMDTLTHHRVSSYLAFPPLPRHHKLNILSHPPSYPRNSEKNPAKRFFSEEEAQRNECAVPRAARQRI